MTISHVITDIAKIAKLNKQLGITLRETFRHKETRELTYPSGHHLGDIYFQNNRGKSTRAWSPYEDETRFNNYLVMGEPGVQDWLEISVQINFPADKYNRRMAGVFVEDENGDILIAHRGKLTKGNAGLKRKDVLREFGSVIDAEDSSKLVKLIPISSLDDQELANRLFEFALRAREIATKLGQISQLNIKDKAQNNPTERSASKQTKSSSIENVQDRILKLRCYYDEYAGSGTTKGYGGGKRTVEHGDIVKALEAKLRGSNESQKAQAIDLAIVSSHQIDLYEVKTSARTTDVYTGVGQLLIHGGCISDLFKGSIKRFLVLPKRPKQSHEQHIIGKAEIQIVTFQKMDGLYEFDGI